MTVNINNMNIKEIAAQNTFRCGTEGHEHYWCYLCGRCLSYKAATIDHIRPESCFDINQNSSFNGGIGTFKNDWLEWFDEMGWPWNNLTLTHYNCNNAKGDTDYTYEYQKMLKDEE